jgi:hypothetical protein
MITTTLTFREQILIDSAIRTRIMWIENFILDNNSEVVMDAYLLELAELKNLLNAYDQT